MPFKRSLEKIRQKPAHRKERIVTFWMITFGLIVLVVWYFTMDFSKMRFDDTKQLIKSTKDSFSSSGVLFDSSLPQQFVDSETTKEKAAASSTSALMHTTNTATSTATSTGNVYANTEATTTDNY